MAIVMSSPHAESVPVLEVALGYLNQCYTVETKLLFDNSTIFSSDGSSMKSNVCPSVTKLFCAENIDVFKLDT